MLGAYFVQLSEEVTERFGADLWDEVLQRCDEDGVFTSIGSYPVRRFERLVRGIVECTAEACSAIVRACGERHAQWWLENFGAGPATPEDDPLERIVRAVESLPAGRAVLTALGSDYRPCFFFEVSSRDGESVHLAVSLGDSLDDAIAWPLLEGTLLGIAPGALELSRVHRERSADRWVVSLRRKAGR